MQRSLIKHKHFSMNNKFSLDSVLIVLAPLKSSAYEALYPSKGQAKKSFVSVQYSPIAL